MKEKENIVNGEKTKNTKEDIRSDVEWQGLEEGEGMGSPTKKWGSSLRGEEAGDLKNQET